MQNHIEAAPQKHKSYSGTGGRAGSSTTDIPVQILQGYLGDPRTYSRSGSIRMAARKCSHPCHFSYPILLFLTFALSTSQPPHVPLHTFQVEWSIGLGS